MPIAQLGDLSEGHYLTHTDILKTGRIIKNEEFKQEKISHLGRPINLTKGYSMFH